MSLPSFIVQLLGENSKTDLADAIRVINNIQTQLQTILKYITKRVQQDNVLLENISLVTGNNPISHTLGRVLTGWSIVDQQGQAFIYRYQSSTNTTLYLNASQPVTVSLLVF